MFLATTAARRTAAARGATTVGWATTTTGVATTMDVASMAGPAMDPAERDVSGTVVEPGVTPQPGKQGTEAARPDTATATSDPGTATRGTATAVPDMSLVTGAARPTARRWAAMTTVTLAVRPLISGAPSSPTKACRRCPAKTAGARKVRMAWLNRSAGGSRHRAGRFGTVTGGGIGR